VAFCGYHGWHDWYLSANLGATTALDGHLLPGLDTKGVPRGLARLMHPFHFNKPDEIEAIVAEHGERLAAIVMELSRCAAPSPSLPSSSRASERSPTAAAPR
jgi:glutamate-1-semialdehyde 2,1-aminomutase